MTEAVRRAAAKGSGPQPPAPGAGRPTDYRPESCGTAKKLASHGANDIEIADALGVHVATYYRWRTARPEFCEAVTTGKEDADMRVERSLYHRAIGYTYDTEFVMPEPKL